MKRAEHASLRPKPEVIVVHFWETLSSGPLRRHSPGFATLFEAHIGELRVPCWWFLGDFMVSCGEGFRFAYVQYTCSISDTTMLFWSAALFCFVLGIVALQDSGLGSLCFLSIITEGWIGKDHSVYWTDSLLALTALNACVSYVFCVCGGRSIGIALGWSRSELSEDVFFLWEVWNSIPDSLCPERPFKILRPLWHEASSEGFILWGVWNCLCHGQCKLLQKLLHEACIFGCTTATTAASTAGSTTSRNLHRL